MALRMLSKAMSRLERPVMSVAGISAGLLWAGACVAERVLALAGLEADRAKDVADHLVKWLHIQTAAGSAANGEHGNE